MFMIIFGGETRGVPGAKDLDSISPVIVDSSATAYLARFLSERCARRCHRHSPRVCSSPFFSEAGRRPCL